MRTINLLFLMFASMHLWAHPMPNSILLLNIREKAVMASLQLPLNELEWALQQPLQAKAAVLIDSFGTQIEAYIRQHWTIQSDSKQFWTLRFQKMRVDSVSESASGAYKELVINVLLIPPLGESNVRKFTMQYEVITHQLVTHSTLVRIQEDWQQGILPENAVQVGAISLDVPLNRVLPFRVHLNEGSYWKGFMAMFRLGNQHIAEGTDHLLFLLLLLLPAPLRVRNGRWAIYGGFQYSFWQLLQIITAFTLGHSLTLILGTIIPFSSHWIEVLIAFSIFCSGIHAIFPIFYPKEKYIASIFGLIHGLAFSDTLSHLELSHAQMLWSILGFNLGIEWMQLLIMLLVLPPLLLICRKDSSFYKMFRHVAALLGLMAALAWMIERIREKPNIISQYLEALPAYNGWIAASIWWIALMLSLYRSQKLSRD